MLRALPEVSLGASPSPDGRRSDENKHTAEVVQVRLKERPERREAVVVLVPGRRSGLGGQTSARKLDGRICSWAVRLAEREGCYRQGELRVLGISPCVGVWISGHISSLVWRKPLSSKGWSVFMQLTESS
jgi:hypothetical protein